ncbi:MAG: ROK family transcriptional regulator [Nocardioidaceae bacterium]|nr:ROK family transcriptional regulator [Nocardioidaceae bacterium]
MTGRARPGSGTNQEAVRRHNLGTLLGHVHREELISRADLTARMGLNRSTIAALVAELEGLGVVRQEMPVGERSSAGRPSIDVSPGERQVFVVAVELRVERVEVARVGLAGHVLARGGGAMPRSREPRAVASVVASLVREMVDGAPDGAALVGIGVGLPGVVSGAGVVGFAPNLRWTAVDLRRLLRDALGVDVAILMGNDADLGVLSEHVRGAGVGCDDLIYLSADIGVGGGVVADGHTLRGFGGFAGEVGHMRTGSSGLVCRCGSRGCWETEIGASAVAAAVECPDDDLAVVAERVRAMTEPNDAMVTVGRELGAGLASLVNVFNPEVVVLGGLLRDVYPLVRRVVARTLEEGALGDPAAQVRIVLPALGADSVLLGAAELAFGPLLEDPASVLADTPVPHPV